MRLAPAALTLLAACSGGVAPYDLALLVALDGARADRSSLCGGPHPTTRTLEALRDERGASTSCFAYAPSPKAPVAMASLVTGELPWEHRYDPRFLDAGWSDHQTLAERAAAEGWHTALVTANPWLADRPGLADGYDDVVAAETWTDLRGADLVAAVRPLLMGERRRLLLTVVSVDARGPWVGPDGQPLSLDAEDVGTDAWRFARGGGSPAWREAFLDAARARYERGLRDADTVVREILADAAEARGTWRGMRLMVTGLRGELLGEGGHLGDAGWVWDAGLRVPLVLLDTTRARPFPPLPETPISTAVATPWLLDGALPRPPVPVAAFSVHERGREVPGDDQVAVWGPGHTKLLSWRGEVSRVAAGESDVNDPPHLPNDSGLLPALGEQAAAWRAHLAWRDAELLQRGLAPRVDDAPIELP